MHSFPVRERAAKRREAKSLFIHIMALKSYIRFGIQISVTVCVCANNGQIMRNRMSLALPNEKYVTIKRVFKFLSAASAHHRVSSSLISSQQRAEKNTC